MNCRHAITRPRSSQVAGRMPHGPARAGALRESPRRRGSGRATISGTRRGQVVQQPGQPERRDERQRRVRLVHQVEALLVHPGTQDLQDPLPVAQLVERVGRLARVLLQVGVELVHRVGAQEVRPAWPDPRTTVSSPPTPGPGGKLEALPQHLRHGRDVRGPRRLVHPQVRSGEEGPDRACVELPAGRHAPMMAGGKDIYAERAWCPPLLMQ